MPAPPGAPEVSVVIPTHRRPELVRRAVGSALDQSVSALEVLVVVDGAEPATLEVLKEIADERLRVVATPTAQGGAAARNVGVREAHGEWIAFLDDDDRWEPEKLERQLAAAAAATAEEPVVFCQLIAGSEEKPVVWPRRGPLPGEEISEYLFRRSGVFKGEGLIQTSTILARRRLMAEVPFREHLKRHQDWDWVLRAARRPGVVFQMVPEPLVRWYDDEHRPRMTHQRQWRASWEWIREMRPLVTGPAYSGFLLTVLAADAAAAGAWGAFLPILRDAIRQGQPRAGDVALYLGLWTVPPALRRAAGALWQRRR